MTQYLNSAITSMDTSTKSEANLMDRIDLSDGGCALPKDVPSQHMDEAELHDRHTGTPIPAGQDDAGDVVGEFSLPRRLDQDLPDIPTLSLADQPVRDHEPHQDLEEEFLDVPIPNVTAGPSTFAYQRALRNRIKFDKLGRGGDYDTRAFTPTFVHDCLMLPGSLANLLGKGSPEQIIHRMTPALLPGFRLYVHTETDFPCLVQSGDPEDYVQGMLIFGEGKGGRDQVHKHYRPDHKRIKLEVEMEISALIPEDERKSSLEYWRPQRKRQWAHAWLWANVRDFDSQVRLDVGPWKLEEYIAGNYNMHQTIRVEKNGLGEDYNPEDEECEERGWNLEKTVDDAPWVPEPEPEPDPQSHEAESTRDSSEAEDDEGRPYPSEVPYGGPGGLSYERNDAAVGKW